MTSTPPEGVPADAWTDLGGNWFHDPTYTLYMVAADGSVTTRPYTDYEIQMATERQNRQNLIAQAKAAISVNQNDIATNDQWLTDNPTATAFQKAVVQQSTRQARQLNALIRLVVEDLTGTN